MEAVEKKIVFDEQGSSVLFLGKQFSKKKAKVVVLFEDEENVTDEKAWMTIANEGNAVDFWNDPTEDIYTSNDGTSYNKQSNEI